MSLTFINGNDDDAYNDEEEDDENEAPETVSTVQLHEELRRVARGEQASLGLSVTPLPLLTCILDGGDDRY